MKNKLLSAVLASLMVVGIGCSHEVESPKVTAATPGPLSPNIVCSDNRTPLREPAEVVISGSGFTPLPTKVLSDDKATLILPTVDFARSEDLVTNGTPSGDAGGGGVPVPTAGEENIRYSGTPVKAGAADPEHSADLSWQSEQQMTVAIRANVDIRPGVYDVTVTNPDKTHKVTMEDALAVVPPPAISSIVPPTICVDQTDQVITIYGGFFARVTTATGTTEEPKIEILDAAGTTVIREYSPDSMGGCAPQVSKFNLDLCDSMTFTVRTGTGDGGVADLQPGTYKVRVTDPEPLSCFSSADITLTVNAPPRVDTVVPGLICDTGGILALTGANFHPGASAELRCGPNRTVTVRATTVDVTSTTAATATFPAGAVAPDCDVVFINADSCEDRPLPHRTVSVTEGPILFNVDPNYVYSDMSTFVKLYVTSLVGTPVVTMWPDANPTQVTTLIATPVAGKNNVIQATIPRGTAAGPYTIRVNDDSQNCPSTTPSALTVTNNLVVTSGTVEPPFGHVAESVAVTITLSSPVISSGPPRAFLNPPNGQGIQLLSVTPSVTTGTLPDGGILDGGAGAATTYTAVIPAMTAAQAGSYAIVFVWPDGQVAVVNAPSTDGGVAPVAYTAVVTAPPVITNATPQTVVENATPAVTITGTGFAADATATFICSNDAGVTQITNAGTTTVQPSCTAGVCTMTATFDATNPGAGSICVVQVRNVADGTFGSFSAVGVTNSSNNLPSAQASRDMNTARRALVATAMKATSASRFVYAIGGDDGTDPNAMDSMEFAPVSVFGAVSPWIQNAMPNAPKLNTRRSYAGTATIGRYVYVFGGYDGAAALGSGERALVLSPEEAPIITDLDLCLAGGVVPCFGTTGAGLDPGVYSYRVAANISATDPENCGGETLASDAMILRLTNVDLGGRKVVARVTWDQPRDSAGTALSGVTGYTIYRTPLNGTPGTDEVLIGTVTGATTLTFADDGSAALGTQEPLPLGSTSAWQATGLLGATRQGPAGAAGTDPADATKAYVYALGGRDGATGRDSYEYLTITKLANGHQTMSATWTSPTVNSIGGARWKAGGFSVTNAEASLVTSPDNFIYVGPGLTAVGATDNPVKVGLVAAGGDLGTIVSVSGPGGTNAGYGYCAIAGQLFTFGGQGFPPSTSVSIVNPAPTLSNSWNAGLTTLTDRHLPGSTIQSAVIFLVGGQTNAPAAAASRSTEIILF